MLEALEIEREKRMSALEFNNFHHRCVMLLGAATNIILGRVVSEEDCKWWLHAIEEVVYKNNPIPIGSKEKS